LIKVLIQGLKAILIELVLLSIHFNIIEIITKIVNDIRYHFSVLSIGQETVA